MTRLRLLPGGLLMAALFASLASPATRRNDLAPAPIDLIGHRTDKNAVGHGNNIALYSGSPPRYFYATHELGDIFSSADGATTEWNPDHVSVQLECADGVREVRHLCVTHDDVIIAEIEARNPTDRRIDHRIEIAGDCRQSRDWRGQPGGDKVTRRVGDYVALIDRNVYPEILPAGLAIVAGSRLKPTGCTTEPAGTYRLVYTLTLEPRSSKRILAACAVRREISDARQKLEAALKQRNPLAANREHWARYFERDVPQFACSDRSVEELYYFRWWLLKFSTAGGNLGYFRYPVVMEGRQAFQTYCCYSAPFMAHDLNWARNPATGFGHIAGMVEAAYEDGRFPWYVSPRTNRVPIHHRSGTGLSLLPQTAWEHYLIHGDKALLRRLYPGMRRNVDWWIKDRDADGNGLFLVDHQLETGMDDLFRWSDTNAELRYEALDATSYAFANLRAVAAMSGALGEQADSARYAAYADRVEKAVNRELWDPSLSIWRDRRPDTGELSAPGAITGFYPFYGDIGGSAQMDAFRRHLLNPAEFWLPFPVPALAKNHPRFKPEGYWEGPSWPAATSHVVEAFARAAKQFDRSLLPQAAELFRRAMRDHLQPRPDFYERYNPLTGKPLSAFRDYMHSWWIDLIIRHGAGLNPQPDGSLVIDPLPMGWTRFALQNAPIRGRRVDVLWSNGDGLTVRVNGKVRLRQKEFRPGADPVHLTL